MADDKVYRDSSIMMSRDDHGDDPGEMVAPLEASEAASAMQAKKKSKAKSKEKKKSKQADEGTAEDRNTVIEPKLYRENGYGDFCFDRLVAWTTFTRSALGKEKNFKKEFYEGLQARSHIPEKKNQFSLERSGPFPFYRLPPEVRKAILRILLGPFFASDGEFDIYIDAVTKPSTDYDLSFKEYRILKRRTGQGVNSIRDVDLYHSAQLMYAHSVARHPNRGFKYDMRANPRLKPTQEKRPSYRWMDWHMIKQLRDMSNVSTLFRDEVAKVVFARTSVTIDMEACDALVDFLKDRPAVLPGIQSLSLFIVIEEMNDANREEKFGEFCTIISQSLELEHVTLFISTWDLEIFEKPEGDNLLACVEALDILNVSRNLAVSIDVEPPMYMHYIVDEVERSDVWEKFRIASEELVEKWEPIIQDLAFPNTLRPSTPETEEMRYLQER